MLLEALIPFYIKLEQELREKKLFIQQAALRGILPLLCMSQNEARPAQRKRRADGLACDEEYDFSYSQNQTSSKQACNAAITETNSANRPFQLSKEQWRAIRDRVEKRGGLVVVVVGSGICSDIDILRKMRLRVKLAICIDTDHEKMEFARERFAAFQDRVDYIEGDVGARKTSDEVKRILKEKIGPDAKVDAVLGALSCAAVAGRRRGLAAGAGYDANTESGSMLDAVECFVGALYHWNDEPFLLSLEQIALTSKADRDALRARMTRIFSVVNWTIRATAGGLIFIDDGGAGCASGSKSAAARLRVPA